MTLLNLPPAERPYLIKLWVARGKEKTSSRLTSGFVKMMQDEEIRQIVLEHLKWSPRVNATHIGVGVRGGVETLAGKLEAEHVALAVKGVRGVAQEIVVRLPTEKRTSDEELAARGSSPGIRA